MAFNELVPLQWRWMAINDAKLTYVNLSKSIAMEQSESYGLVDQL